MLKNLIIIAVVVLVLLILFFIFKKTSNASKNDINNTISIDSCSARIDIFNLENRENTISVISQTPSEMLLDKYDNPEWINQPGIGTSFNFPSNSTWQTGEIKFKTVGSGLLQIHVMGVHKVNPSTGEEEKICVDYRNVTINGTPIINDERTIWHNDREIFSMKSEDNQVYTLKFEYKKH